jgi:hypothetical protein
VIFTFPDDSGSEFWVYERHEGQVEKGIVEKLASIGGLKSTIARDQL